MVDTIPALLDPIGTAELLDSLLPPRPDGRHRDRRDAYRLLAAAPVGVRVELPGRLYANRDRLIEWLLGGGTAAHAAPAEDKA